MYTQYPETTEVTKWNLNNAHIVIGNLQIRYYGIIIVVALLAGAYVASLIGQPQLATTATMSGAA